MHQSKKRSSPNTVEPPVAKKKQRVNGPISQNWRNLKQTLVAESKPTINYREIRQKRKPQPETPTESQRETINDGKLKQQSTNPLPANIKKNPKAKLLPTSNSAAVTKVIGLDCEMVGVGPDGFDSALARVTIVNSYGTIIYDKHVEVPEKVTNYRTKFSGIRKQDLQGAPPFALVQKEVAKLIKDRIVVGHGLKNDFRALLLQHPYSLTRDTSRYGPLQRSKGRPHALRHLTKSLFGVQIQSGKHDPGEDARAAVLVYKHVKDAWEKAIKAKRVRQAKMAKKNKAKKVNSEVTTEMTTVMTTTSTSVVTSTGSISASYDD